MSVIDSPAVASPLAPPLPGAAGQSLHWRQPGAAALSLAAAHAASRHPGLTLLVTPDTQSALRLEAELGFFAGPDLEILVFPDWETLPYDVFSPHQDIVSQRLATLSRLPRAERGVLIVPVATLLQRLAPRSYLDGHVLLLSVSERLDPTAFRRRLEAAGYTHVSQVMEHGEFTVRGSIIDLYPMGAELPYRIDLFDDEVESIRTFDPESQLSVDKVQSVELLPAREFPLTKQAITRFRNAFRSRFSGDPQRSHLYREISNGMVPGGAEYYLPLFFDSTETLFDYLPDNTLALSLAGSDAAMDTFHGQLAERYEQRRHDSERPILTPAELFLDPAEATRRLDAYPRIRVWPEAHPDGVRFNTTTLPPVALHNRAGEPAADLKAFLDDFSGRVLIAAESAGRREMLLEMLRRFQILPRVVEDWRAFLADDAPLAITVAPLEQGLCLEEPKLAVLTEALLQGERVRQSRRRSAPARDPETVIRNLTDLSIGAPVVHEDHGVGRYRGLERLAVAGQEAEFVVLEYAEGAKLYVPVASLHLISRYTGASPESAPLHRLGSEQWQKARRKAAERVTDAAAELLDIYARREVRPGRAFEIQEVEYQAFAGAFPFEETPDQEAAIHAVVADLRSKKSMDRVVCGDVGFGKTEVAMRAAFVAVQGGSQVGVLVPTTLLAQQHYQNFADRFADWPVRVEVLSRFRSKKEQDAVLADLAAGKVDILIGTHKLLQAGVKFQNLGLVIIDEEHRFGVRHKEKLKSLRAEVDVLTLTATPIPRTLNMAMSGLRDLSIITTPPAGRLAVKTFVGEWNKTLIQEAILRELKRGGQVYFLHNEVQTIEKTAREVAELVPEARVAVAHGQMRERELEQVMLDFYHQRCNVLVCSTIVESGIDVPTANTIIINRADKLGLAQLHQLRGRVGRSHHRAYAYLVTPNRKAMTPDAVKRLEAIESLEDLGAGFMLANHDMEIRGAGELLGEDQSGQIHEIGFSLYMELLERAVEALKAGKTPELDRPLDHGPEIDLQVPALIPDDYLPDVHSRLILYKRIASADSDAALRELQVEMIDRFGLLPEPVRNLFRVTELKLRAIPVGIRKIEAGPRGGRILFGPEPRVDTTKLIQLIQQQPRTYKLDGQDKLRFTAELADPEARVRTLSGLLDTIAA